MTVNPYESPTIESLTAARSFHERAEAILTALCAAIFFVIGAFPGLFTYAWFSIVAPDLEGADRTREIASKVFYDVAVHAIVVGYLVIMCGLLCIFFVFLFAAIFGTPSIRRAWRIVLVSGTCLALWTYGYIIACSYGWIDSWWLK